MKPLRKNVALAIDGGGIRGVIVAKALMMLEQALNSPSQQIFQLTAGTSTGAILAAGIASGLTARQLFDLYVELGAAIFPKTWRSALWPMTRYRYESEPFVKHLQKQLGDKKMGDFWEPDARRDVSLIPALICWRIAAGLSNRGRTNIAIGLLQRRSWHQARCRPIFRLLMGVTWMVVWVPMPTHLTWQLMRSSTASIGICRRQP